MQTDLINQHISPQGTWVRCRDLAQTTNEQLAQLIVHKALYHSIGSYKIELSGGERTIEVEDARKYANMILATPPLHSKLAILEAIPYVARLVVLPAGKVKDDSSFQVEDRISQAIVGPIEQMVSHALIAQFEKARHDLAGAKRWLPDRYSQGPLIALEQTAYPTICAVWLNAAYRAVEKEQGGKFDRIYLYTKSRRERDRAVRVSEQNAGDVYRIFDNATEYVTRNERGKGQGFTLRAHPNPRFAGSCIELQLMPDDNQPGRYTKTFGLMRGKKPGRPDNAACAPPHSIHML